MRQEQPRRRTGGQETKREEQGCWECAEHNYGQGEERLQGPEGKPEGRGMLRLAVQRGRRNQKNPCHQESRADRGPPEWAAGR